MPFDQNDVQAIGVLAAAQKAVQSDPNPKPLTVRFHAWSILNDAIEHLRSAGERFASDLSTE